MAVRAASDRPAYCVGRWRHGSDSQVVNATTVVVRVTEILRPGGRCRNLTLSRRRLAAVVLARVRGCFADNDRGHRRLVAEAAQLTGRRKRPVGI